MHAKQPTVIAISGSGLQPWIWDSVAKNISYDFVTVDRDSSDHSSQSLVDDADKVIKQYSDGPIILIVHSVGGVIGLELLRKNEQAISHFVAISAALPRPGKPFTSILPIPQRYVMPLILKVAGTKPPESIIKAGLLNDIDPELSERMVREFRTESKRLFTDSTSRTDIPNVPSTYIITDLDKELPVTTQSRQAASIDNMKTIHIQSGHLPMISKPDELAKILQEIGSNL